MHFIAGWNLPGCLPEAAPVEFDDPNDAFGYLLDELVSRADECDGAESFESATEARRAVVRLNDLPAPRVGETVAVGAGLYVYWVAGFAGDLEDS